MAILMPPDYRLLRDPQLLTAHKRGVNVKIDKGHELAKGLVLFLLLKGYKMQELAAVKLPRLRRGEGNVPVFYGDRVYFPINRDNVLIENGKRQPCFGYDGYTNASSYYHMQFTHLAFFADIGLDPADVAGPLMLFEIGGNANGLSIFYRTGPDKFSVVTVANASNEQEYQFSRVFVNKERIRVLFRYDGLRKEISFFLNGKLLETLSTLTGTIPYHSSVLGICGVAPDTDSSGTVVTNGSYAGQKYAVPASMDPWHGDIYSAGLWLKRLNDAQCSAITRDPYQFLIPA